MFVVLSGKEEAGERMRDPGTVSFVSIILADLIEKVNHMPAFQV